MQPKDQLERIWRGESPIRVLREHRGLTLSELASLIGVAPEQLERDEKARRVPRQDRLEVIAQALGVRAIDLRQCYKRFSDCAKLVAERDAPQMHVRSGRREG